MATESKKIFQVEVQGIPTIRELKSEVVELKEKLRSTEAGTEEYKRTLNKLTEAEQAVTDAMRLKRDGIEALDGSYNALSDRMQALRRVYREVADDFTRQEIAKEINNINDQLKALDADTGNFQRNVGNYQAAFEEGTKNILKNLNIISPEFGKIGRTINSMIPLIKKATTAATTGLSSVKKAIIGTGIGALVVLIGTLIANWDKFKNVVVNTIPFLRQAREESEKWAAHIKAIGDTNIALEQNLNHKYDLLRALGKTELEIADIQREDAYNAYLEAQGHVEHAQEQLDKLGITYGDLYKKLKEELDKYTEVRDANYEKWIEAENNFTKEQIKAGRKISDERDAQAEKARQLAAERIRLGEEEAAAFAEAWRKAQEQLTSYDDSARTNLMELAFPTSEKDKKIKEINDFADAWIASIIASGDESKGTIDDVMYYMTVALARLDEEEIPEDVIPVPEPMEYKPKWEEYIEFIDAMSQRISSILGSCGDAWQSLAKAQFDSGKISEGEYKRQFEAAKGLMIAEATINTIAGAIKAFMANASVLPVAIASAAAVTAAGVAQIIKIKNTKPGGSSSLSSSSVGAGINQPTITEYNPNYVEQQTGRNEITDLANALSQNPMRAYVVESDISAAQSVARQREQETTF